MIFFFLAIIESKELIIKLNKDTSDKQTCVSVNKPIICSSIFESLNKLEIEPLDDLTYYLPNEFEFKDDFEHYKQYDIISLPRSITITGQSTSKANGTLFLPASVQVIFGSSIELNYISLDPEINNDKHSFCNLINVNACFYTIGSPIIQDGTYYMKSFDIIRSKVCAGQINFEDIIINKEAKAIYQVEQGFVDGNTHRLTINGGSFIQEAPTMCVYSDASIRETDIDDLPTYSLFKLPDVLNALKSLEIDDVTIYFETDSLKTFDIHGLFILFSEGWKGPSTVTIDTIEPDAIIVGLLYYQSRDYENQCTFKIGNNIKTVSAVIDVSPLNPTIGIITAIPLDITLNLSLSNDFKSSSIEIKSKDDIS